MSVKMFKQISLKKTCRFRHVNMVPPPYRRYMYVWHHPLKSLCFPYGFEESTN